MDAKLEFKTSVHEPLEGHAKGTCDTFAYVKYAVSNAPRPATALTGHCKAMLCSHRKISISKKEKNWFALQAANT
jgi:hypothetical protein